MASELSGGSVSGPEHLVELDASGNVVHVWPDGGWELALDASGERVFMPVWTDTGSLRALELPGP